jgi:hypothetical protein
MPKCETYGNDYDKAFQVTLNGKSHIVDSFECAIQALAPTCPHCGTRVVGHGSKRTIRSFAVFIARSSGHRLDACAVRRSGDRGTAV